MGGEGGKEGGFEGGGGDLLRTWLEKDGKRMPRPTTSSLAAVMRSPHPVSDRAEFRNRDTTTRPRVMRARSLIPRS